MAFFVNGAVTQDTNSGTKTVLSSASGLAVGELIVLLCWNTGNTGAWTVTDDNADGRGTYTEVVSALKNASADLLRFYVRNDLVGSISGTTTFSMAPGATSGGGIRVYRWGGMSRAGLLAIRSEAGVLQTGKQENQASGTPTISYPVATLTTNPVISAAFNGTSPGGLTVPSGWTARGNVGYSVPTTGQNGADKDNGFAAVTVTWGSSSATAFGAVVLELDGSAQRPIDYISYPPFIQNVNHLSPI